MKKLILIIGALFALSVQAQNDDWRGGYSELQDGDELSIAQKTVFHEVSFYIQNGWGFGYSLRKDYGKFFAWDIFGASFQTGGFVSPANNYLFNLRLLGARAYSPSWKRCRAYANLDLGYTMYHFDYNDEYYNGYRHYDYSGETHGFGLDFGLGLQFNNRFSIGYNLNYCTQGDKTHWCKLSVLF